MIEETKLAAPTLPDGMLFRVTRSKYGSVIVQLRRKVKLFGSLLIDQYDICDSNPSLYQVQVTMKRLKASYVHPPLSYLGDYPPKTVIE